MSSKRPTVAELQATCVKLANQVRALEGRIALLLERIAQLQGERDEAAGTKTWVDPNGVRRPYAEWPR